MAEFIRKTLQEELYSIASRVNASKKRRKHLETMCMKAASEGEFDIKIPKGIFVDDESISYSDIERFAKENNIRVTPMQEESNEFIAKLDWGL